MTLFLVTLLLASVALSPFSLDLALSPRLTLLATGLALVFIQWSRGRTGITTRTDAGLVSLIAFTVLNVAAIFWSLNTAEALFECSRVVLFTILVLTAGWFLNEKEDVLRVSKLASILVFISLAVLAWQAAGIHSIGKEALYSLTGLNAHKNLVSSFLFLLLYFVSYGWKNSGRGWNYFFVAALVVSLLLIGFLRTKAVWTGLLTGGFVYVALYLVRNRKAGGKAIWVLGAATLIAANLFYSLLLPGILDNALGRDGEKTKFSAAMARIDEERLVLWDKTYHVISKDPLIGVGPGNWQVHFPDATLTGIWRAEDLNFTFQRPHNDFLWVISETGYTGFNLLLVFLLFVLFGLVRSLQAATDASLKADISLCAAALCGYAIIAFFDFPKERIEHLAWLALLTGRARSFFTDEVPVRAKWTRLSTPSLLVPALILLAIAFIGWKRHEGEMQTREVYDSRQRGNQYAIIAAGQKAESFAYTVDPTSVPLAWYTGNGYASLGQFAPALEEFRRAYRFNPYNRNVLNDLGSALAMIGQPDSAKVMYREAARISPRFDDAKLNMAALLIRENKFGEAGQWLNSLMHDSERRTAYERIVKMNTLSP
jgi:O-antigen ligase